MQAQLLAILIVDVDDMDIHFLCQCAVMLHENFTNDTLPDGSINSTAATTTSAPRPPCPN
jgi:hypothetical protein